MKNLEQLAMSETFWDDPQKAQEIINLTNRIKKMLDEYHQLQRQLTDINESLQELKNDFNQEYYEMLEAESTQTLALFNAFEIKVLLSNEYDDHDAIVEIHPGAGGTESQDWAEMLYRMYSRWANKKNFKVNVIDFQVGDEAGIKSVTFSIEGDYAYGYLKSEKGVHRLVRISPFDSSGRRHTSFASVDIMPKIEHDDSIVLDMNELIIDTHRASGAGGQHVNKTDSAVRITHLPSGISVHVQSERSQMQNREQAIALIKAKLAQLKKEQQAQEISELKGEQKNIEWGSQIRSYVFMPYTLVKDTRTQVEMGNIQAVMDGEIDPFIQGYLKKAIK